MRVKKIPNELCGKLCLRVYKHSELLHNILLKIYNKKVFVETPLFLNPFDFIFSAY